MDKKPFYEQLVAQVEAIIGDESDVVANMANLSAILFDALEQVNWVGFYRCVNDELVLGPFQGKVACIRIPVGQGVCGTAVSENKTQRIADVHQFSGHIACDAASNAEIVIPVRINDRVIGVLDIDSVAFERFDEQDQQWLEQVVQVFEQTLIRYNVDKL
ncbi:free methionine-R-sulfoxide reductase YebR [Thalassotalea insulae]|uniref:Free methionine-R-sulfoxide reductase YebR n=1 Tax=Thalassotalea insulae TaxID=2056778 RepID=A0ABQ6GN75_9GAMM|nr:GAF domain-containing protein [Thalassotalea insulae]GLX76774.1 free methionine-R-sulfoxide reductase YebR [Thalassotalea insulae]